MTNLILVLGSGKGTWSSAAEIIKAREWEKIVIITNEFGKENFPKRFRDIKNYKFIIVNDYNPVEEITKKLYNAFKQLFPEELEVAINIESGSGKLHMALLAALISAGISYRFVVLGENKNLLELTASPYSFKERYT